MKYLLSFLLSVLLLARTKSMQIVNEITKVELARRGAWSDYGAAMSIDSSLNYKYYDANVKHGYYIGKVPEAFWDTLNQKFERLKYKTLPITDNKQIEDANYFELYYTLEQGQKTNNKG